jgi:ubiquinone/menaquinone biosynthesis C-methylase UbiE
LLTDLHSKRILDLACGTGRWLETLMRQGAESGVGVDCSIAMLRVGVRKSCLAGRLARATCENLPFRAAVFDLAICSFALGHLRDLGPTVRELARVTKPQADVFVSDLHPEAYARGWRVGFRDGRNALEIETMPREGEEKPIFARAGKAHFFAEACQSAAVLVCHFKRLSDRLTPSTVERLAEALQ